MYCMYACLQVFPQAELHTQWSLGMSSKSHITTILAYFPSSVSSRATLTHRDSEIIMESEINAGLPTVGSHATFVQLCQNKQSLKTFAHRYIKQNMQIVTSNTGWSSCVEGSCSDTFKTTQAPRALDMIRSIVKIVQSRNNCLRRHHAKFTSKMLLISRVYGMGASILFLHTCDATCRMRWVLVSGCVQVILRYHFDHSKIAWCGFPVTQKLTKYLGINGNQRVVN